MIDKPFSYETKKNLDKHTVVLVIIQKNFNQTLLNPDLYIKAT
jgi:hypothetical protein